MLFLLVTSAKGFTYTVCAMCVLSELKLAVPAKDPCKRLQHLFDLVERCGFNIDATSIQYVATRLKGGANSSIKSSRC